MKLNAQDDRLKAICESIIYSRNDSYSRELDNVDLTIYAVQPLYASIDILSLKDMSHPEIVEKVRGISGILGLTKHDVKYLMQTIEMPELSIYLDYLFKNAKYKLEGNKLVLIDIGQNLNMKFDDDTYDYNDFIVALEIYLYLISRYILSGSMLIKVVASDYSDGGKAYETINIYLSRYEHLESISSTRTMFRYETYKLYRYVYCREISTTGPITENRF